MALETKVSAQPRGVGRPSLLRLSGIVCPRAASPRFDELAAAAKQDPVSFRHGLFGKARRARTVLELAPEKAVRGKPLPGAGCGRAVFLLYSAWGSLPLST